MERLQRLPVPVLPTFVGVLTLSNIYGGLGYSWLRYLCMAGGTIVLLAYLVKIFCYPKVCLGEYQNTIPCSLYAALFMMLMILSAFWNELYPGAGLPLLLLAVCLHATHICVFTYRNVISGLDKSTMMPSWFVTYNGIMVSCVVGSAILPKVLTTIITYYGIVIYFILIPFMIWRMLSLEVKPPVYHTMAVVLAPCSLCVVSYLNVVQEPIPSLLYVLYCCVLCSLLFIICKLPKFFSYPFTPGYAGMTFPMAIGIVATNKMTGWFKGQGLNELAVFTTQLSGFQTYLTTAIVGYVLLRFIMMALKTEMK